MMRTPPRLAVPTLEERFGLNLWRSRRRADLSQEDLANLVGLSRNAIYRQPREPSPKSRSRSGRNFPIWP